MINANKPKTWKKDIAQSVDFYNDWFMRFAPEAFKKTRVQTAEAVLAAFGATDNFRNINSETLLGSPSIIQTLRMSTCPPLARDRLIGLAYANKNLVLSMEMGRVPSRERIKAFSKDIESICDIFSKLLDRDILPWLSTRNLPTDKEKERVRLSLIGCAALLPILLFETLKKTAARCITDFRKT